MPACQTTAGCICARLAPVRDFKLATFAYDRGQTILTVCTFCNAPLNQDLRGDGIVVVAQCLDPKCIKAREKIDAA